MGRSARGDRVGDDSASTQTFGAEAILPYCYGGSNGLLTQDATDAILFRRLGASRLLRTLCAAPTGAANQALYGKMPSVAYQDYPAARLIILWGVNPGVSGIHAMPFLKAAQKNGARIVVIDPRVTTVARNADLYLPVRPGTDVVVALALHRVLFEEGHADQAFLAAHTTGADALRARAAEWTIERAADVAGSRSRPSCGAWQTGTSNRTRRWCDAAGDWSAIATAATPRWRCSRCPPSAESSACAAAATR